MKAWLVPLLLGLAVAAATAALGPRLVDTRPPPPTAWEVHAAPGYVLPFEPQNASHVLVLAPLGMRAAVAGLERDGFDAATTQWWTPRLALVATGRSAGHACPCIPPSGDADVRVTIYVFREGGTLLATNDAPDRVARFEPDGYYSAFPDGTWHLGPGRGPPGTQAIPVEWRPVLEPLLDGLAGLGTGDVATAAILDHPHRDAIGPLFVTLRVDAVLAVGGAAPA